VIAAWLKEFLVAPPAAVGPISNERSLQLELAVGFREAGFQVEFEKCLRVPRLHGSTLKPKINLDLFVTMDGKRYAVELKVPVNGQHPETMYAFCADIEFVEAIVRAGEADSGVALMLTDDDVFWRDSGRGSWIHNHFRVAGLPVTGPIQRPTGAKDSRVVLAGIYDIASCWGPICSDRLLPESRCLIVEVA
jgi:hypothetical protein